MLINVKMLSRFKIALAVFSFSDSESHSEITIWQSEWNQTHCDKKCLFLFCGKFSISISKKELKKVEKSVYYQLLVKTGLPIFVKKRVNYTFLFKNFQFSEFSEIIRN